LVGKVKNLIPKITDGTDNPFNLKANETYYLV